MRISTHHALSDLKIHISSPLNSANPRNLPIAE